MFSLFEVIYSLFVRESLFVGLFSNAFSSAEVIRHQMRQWLSMTNWG